MTTWGDIISSWQAVLEVPTILVTGAENVASKVTGKPPVIIPQSVVNAATGQTATSADVKAGEDMAVHGLINTLPSFNIFSGLSWDPNNSSKFGGYMLIGSAAIMAGYLLTRKR